MVVQHLTRGLGRMSLSHRVCFATQKGNTLTFCPAMLSLSLVSSWAIATDKHLFCATETEPLVINRCAGGTEGDTGIQHPQASRYLQSFHGVVGAEAPSSRHTIPPALHEPQSNHPCFFVEQLKKKVALLFFFSFFFSPFQVSLLNS